MVEQVEAVHIDLVVHGRVKPALSVESSFVKTSLSLVTNILDKAHSFIKSMSGDLGHLLVFMLGLIGDAVEDLGDLFGGVLKGILNSPEGRLRGGKLV